MRTWTGKIAVGYDGSAPGRDALVLGELLARTAGAELLAVRVQSKHGQPATIEALEGELAAALATSPVSFQALAPAGGQPATALLELATADEAIGLIVLGSSHRAGIGKVMPGGTAERLLAGTPCSIAVAPRGYGEASPADDLRVLAVGFDTSPEGNVALEVASGLAAAAEATLRVITVGARPPESPEAVAAAAGNPTRDLQSELHDAVAALPDDLRALPVYERGEVARALLEHAEQGVDLLVVGSRGRGPVGSVLLGSTSAAVIAAASCPVVVVPRPALASNGSS